MRPDDLNARLEKYRTLVGSDAWPEKTRRTSAVFRGGWPGRNRHRTVRTGSRSVPDTFLEMMEVEGA